MTRIRIATIAVLLFALALPAFASTYSMGPTGVEISGDLALTFRELDKHSRINTNFRQDDPFNTYRVRLFLGKAWTEEIRADIELLYDSQADARVQGAYLTFFDIFGSPVFAKVGLIPSPFGNFSHRGTYFNQNGLIGTPAMWHMHTPLSGRGHQSNSDFWPRSETNTGGVPPMYEACWETGASLHYEEGIVEAALGLTQGTISNPPAYDNDGYQGIVKAGLHPTPGLRFGASGAYGPWIKPGAPDSVFAGSDLESFMQTAGGLYLEYTFGHWQFFSEGYYVDWQLPQVYEESVSLMSAYAEARWNFRPDMYLAGRYDVLTYSEIAVNDDGTGGQRPWGYDFDRVEAAIGYRIIREGYIRLNYQGTLFRSDAAEDIHMLALQFFFAF